MKSSWLVLCGALTVIPRLAAGQVDSTPAHVTDSTPPPVVESPPPPAGDSTHQPALESSPLQAADSTHAPVVESPAPEGDSTHVPALAAPPLRSADSMAASFRETQPRRLAPVMQPVVAPTGPQTVDRIVAVVGVAPILSSQLDEQLLMARSQGTQLPDDSAGLVAVRHQILDQLVSEELLVQQAERDTSIRVTEQEIEDQVQKTVDNVHRQFSGQSDFLTQLQAAGFASEEEWRRWLSDNQRRAILQQRLIEGLRQKGKLRPIPPTEEEMRSFWEEDRQQRPKQPPQITYRQIVIAVSPDSEAVERARVQAESLKVALRHGANFVELAKTYSADSATRSQGGELGWFRRGVMVKAFEEVAFRLKPGEISDVVRTPFGFHIIQVERIQPAEIQARHILIQPALSAEQVARTRRLADSVYQALQVGASFDSLLRRHADEEDNPLNEDVPVAQLPPDYAKALGKVTTPGVQPPFEIGADTPRPKFAVVEVTKIRSEGDLRYEDVKDRLRQQMGQQLAIKRYIDTLRRSTYVEIRL